MYIGLHVKYPLSFTDFNDTWMFQKILKKLLNIKFHENTSSGSRAVPYGQTDEQTDIKNLIIVFRSSTNVPKNQSLNTA